MKQFYAYIHRRPDGSAFYVGKGCGGRAFAMASRNQFHKRTVALIGRDNVKVEIVPAESETHALALEAAFIRVMRQHEYRLTNLTDGGEHGPSGYRHTEEAKEKIRKTSLGRMHMIGKSPSEGTVAKLRAAAERQWGMVRAGEIEPPKRVGRRGERTTPEHRREVSRAAQRRRRAAAKAALSTQ